MNNPMQQLWLALSNTFHAGFSASYSIEDTAWIISADNSDIEPFRISDESASGKDFDEILKEAIDHFEKESEA